MLPGALPVSWASADAPVDTTSLWLLLPTEQGTEALALAGTPVPAGGPLLLQHVFTGRALCAEAGQLLTAFGSERLVSARNESGQEQHGRLHALEADAAGDVERSGARLVGRANLWRLAGAQ